MRADTILYKVIEIIFDAIALLLGARIILRFFGANSATPIVRWLYDISQPLISPFAGIFPNTQLGGTFMIDIPALIALVVYSLIGYAILSVISGLQNRYMAGHGHSHAI